MNDNLVIICCAALRAGVLARAGQALLVAALIATIFGGAAAARSAASKQAVRQACANDVHTLCAGVLPGGGRIKQCMIEKSNQLSDACKDAMLGARAMGGK